MNGKERYQFIDVAKGMAIIGVVIAHHASGVDSAENASFYAYAGKLIFSVVMPFFFLVSGAFMRRRLETERYANLVVFKKISSSLLMPFYSLSMLFFALTLALPASYDAPSAGDMIKALLYMQSSGPMMPSGVLWFLFTLYTASLITFVAIRLARLNIYTLLVFAVAARALSHTVTGVYYFGVDKLCGFYVYYAAGYLLSGLLLGGRLFKRPASIAIYFGYWAVAIGTRMILGFESSIAYDLATLFGILISTAGSLYVLDLSDGLVTRFPRGAPTRFLGYCGANSIVLYVFHTPVGLVAKEAVKRIGIAGVDAAFVLLVVTGVLAPLGIGALLRRNAAIYTVLLGRNP